MEGHGRDRRGARQEIDPSALEAARTVSPEAFLRARYGREVFAARNGRSIRVDKVLRADRGPDGRWVSCDWFGGGIGDNVALVRHTVGCGFVEAIEHLVGTAFRPVAPVAPPPREPARTRPRLPRLANVGEGRRYLAGRGVSEDTILAAEECGALSYCAGAVAFLGRDHLSPSREIRLVNLRYLDPRTGDDGKPMTKRDLAGSDKDFPVLLRGDPGLVEIVEGGVNALAVRDLSLLSRGVAPTVIATGGVGVRHWLTRNPVLADLVAGADHVVVTGENETDAAGNPDPEKQARTDELRTRLQEAVAGLRDGVLPELRYPPAALKDAADWLADCIAGGAAPEADPGSPLPSP